MALFFTPNIVSEEIWLPRVNGTVKSILLPQGQKMIVFWDKARGKLEGNSE